MKFHIANMTCGGCARGITTAIKELDSNASLDMNRTGFVGDFLFKLGYLT